VTIENAPRDSGAREAPHRGSELAGRAITLLIVVGPAVALALALPLLWGRAIHLRDVIMAGALYLITGFGVTVGYHRMFCHRSFTPNRALKIVLAAAGSMAVQGSLIGWVANHRRHHVFSDTVGDPHSPHRYGSGPAAQLRGLFHAHVGWLFSSDPTSAERYAPELLNDRDVVLINRLFPLFALGSLGATFALGWGLSGTISGAITALLWAGLVRMALLHHVTWSVNSLCHMFGSRPFSTKDGSTNFGALALLSFGECWHNFHHACPSSARHGVLRYQLDPSAALIRLFERLGWATKVRWPSDVRIRACATP